MGWGREGENEKKKKSGSCVVVGMLWKLRFFQKGRSGNVRREAGVIDIDLVCWVTLYSILFFVFGLFISPLFFKKLFYTLGNPFKKTPDYFPLSFHRFSFSFSFFSVFFFFSISSQHGVAQVEMGFVGE